MGIEESLLANQPPEPDAQVKAGEALNTPDLTTPEDLPRPVMPISLPHLMRDYAKKYDVPYDLGARMLNQESSGDTEAVSKKGAMGLMQLMPGTAQGLGVTNPFDPIQNVDAGLRYLAQNKKLFGSWAGALVAYNAGPARAVSGEWVNFKETRDYLTKILGPDIANQAIESAKAGIHPRQWADYGGVAAAGQGPQLTEAGKEVVSREQMYRNQQNQAAVYMPIEATSDPAFMRSDYEQALKDGAIPGAYFSTGWATKSHNLWDSIVAPLFEMMGITPEYNIGGGNKPWELRWQLERWQRLQDGLPLNEIVPGDFSSPWGAEDLYFDQRSTDMVNKPLIHSMRELEYNYRTAPGGIPIEGAMLHELTAIGQAYINSFMMGLPGAISGEMGTPLHETLTTPGALAQGAAEFAGFIGGPAKIAGHLYEKLPILGTRWLPSSPGWAAYLKAVGEQGTQMAMAMPLANLAQNLQHSRNGVEAFQSLLNDAKMGALIGALYPSVGFLMDNRALRFVTAMVGADLIRSFPDKYSSMPDIIAGIQNGTLSTRDLAMKVSWMLVDGYFGVHQIGRKNATLNEMANRFVNEWGSLKPNEFVEAQNAISKTRDLMAGLDQMKIIPLEQRGTYWEKATYLYNQIGAQLMGGKRGEADVRKPLRGEMVSRADLSEFLREQVTAAGLLPPELRSQYMERIMASTRVSNDRGEVAEAMRETYADLRTDLEQHAKQTPEVTGAETRPLEEPIGEKTVVGEPSKLTEPIAGLEVGFQPSSLYHGGWAALKQMVAAVTGSPVAPPRFNIAYVEQMIRNQMLGYQRQALTERTNVGTPIEGERLVKEQSERGEVPIYEFGGRTGQSYRVNLVDFNKGDPGGPPPKADWFATKEWRLFQGELGEVMGRDEYMRALFRHPEVLASLPKMADRTIGYREGVRFTKNDVMKLQVAASIATLPHKEFRLLQDYASQFAGIKAEGKSEVKYQPQTIGVVSDGQTQLPAEVLNRLAMRLRSAETALVSDAGTPHEKQLQEAMTRMLGEPSQPVEHREISATELRQRVERGDATLVYDDQGRPITQETVSVGNRTTENVQHVIADANNPEEVQKQPAQIVNQLKRDGLLVVTGDGPRAQEAIRLAREKDVPVFQLNDDGSWTKLDEVKGKARDETLNDLAEAFHYDTPQLWANIKPLVLPKKLMQYSRAAINATKVTAEEFRKAGTVPDSAFGKLFSMYLTAGLGQRRADMQYIHETLDPMIPQGMGMSWEEFRGFSDAMQGVAGAILDPQFKRAADIYTRFNKTFWDAYSVMNKKLRGEFQDGYLRQMWMRDKDGQLIVIGGQNLFDTWCKLPDEASQKAFVETLKNNPKLMADRKIAFERQAEKQAKKYEESLKQDQVSKHDERVEKEGEPLQSKDFTHDTSYLEQKHIPDYSTGMILGLLPRDTNPIMLMRRDLMAKMRWMMEAKLIDFAIKQNMVVPCEAPFIQDIIRDNPDKVILTGKPADIFRETYASMVPERVLREAEPGTPAATMPTTFAVHRDVATLLDRTFSWSLWESPGYTAWRPYLDMVRKLQVGVSFFHFVMITKNIVCQGAGEGLIQSLGALFDPYARPWEERMDNFYQGAKRLGKSITIVPEFLDVHNRAKEALKAWYENPDIAPFVKEYVQAGMKLPDMETIRPFTEAFTDAFCKIFGQRGLGYKDKILETISWPLMTYFVPMVKLGSFLKMRETISNELDAKYASLPQGPDNDLMRQREQLFELQKAGEHLDNVHGQMNYDNLPINRWLRDALFIGFNYPGWGIGSYRWMYHAARGSWKSAREAIRGEGMDTFKNDAQARHAMTFATGMVVQMAVYNTLLNLFMTGEGPDVRDIMVGPRTGRILSNGAPERMRTAGYEREVLEAATIAKYLSTGHFQKAAHEIGSLWESKELFLLKQFSELTKGTDYFGNEIIDPEANFIRRQVDMGKYLAQSLVPISLRAPIQYLTGGTDTAKSPLVRWGGFFGISRVPKHLSGNEVTDVMDRYFETKAGKMLLAADQPRRDIHTKVTDLVETGDIGGAQDMLMAAVASGALTRRQMAGMMQEIKLHLADPVYGGLRTRFSKVQDMGYAIKAYAAADPIEKQTLMPILMKKWGNADTETRHKHYEEYLDALAK